MKSSSTDNNTMLYSTTEAARLLGRQYYQVVYLLKTRQTPEVARVNSRRVFTPADILALANAFGLGVGRIEELKDYFARHPRSGGEHGINE